MDKRSKNMAKRILAALLSVMLVSGTAVMTPAYKNISSGIVVNAVEPSQGFEFSAANVTFTMNGEDLTVSESGEIHIAANAANVQPNVTIKDGDYTLTDADVTVEFGEGNWTTPGSEITVTVVGIGAYEDTTPVQFTFVVDLKTGNLYDGKVSIADLKAGDILKKGTTLRNGYVTGSTDVDNFVNTPKIVLLGGRYMGEDETGIAEEDYSAPENFLSWGGSISIDEETSNLILPMYVSGTDEDTNVHKVTGVFSPIGENGEDGDAWQVFSNENGVLMLQGVLAPIDISDVFKVESVAPVAYTGEALTPVVVKWKNEEDYESDPVEGEDYFISYENNVEAGVATATIVPADVENYYGTIEKNFEIMALFDLSEVAEEILEIERANGTVVYDKDSGDVSFLTNKVALANLDKVVSRVELQLKPNVASVYVDKEVDANNKVLAIKSPYEYTIHGGNKAKASNVKATHTHVFAGENTANTSVLNLKCLNEYDAPTVKVAELTVKSGEYFYGDHVPIQKKYVDDFDDNPANRYNIQKYFQRI